MEGSAVLVWGCGSLGLPAPLSCWDALPNPSILSELIKRGFNMSLPLPFTCKQSHEIKWEQAWEGHWGAGAFPSISMWTFFLSSKSLMLPIKRDVTCKCGWSVCVFPIFFVPCHLPLKAKQASPLLPPPRPKQHDPHDSSAVLKIDPFTLHFMPELSLNISEAHRKIDH